MACECNISLANSGSACVPILEEARQYIFVPTFKEDGTKNFIDLSTAAFDTAFYTSQLNADSDERWRPSLVVNLVTDERGDAITQDLGGGRLTFIADGTRTVVATMIGKLANPQLLGKLKDMRCVEMSAYVITKNGGLLGTELSSDKTKLFPIRIENETFQAILIKHSVNNTVNQGVQMNWIWSVDERDEDLRQVTAGEMTDSVAGIKGLIDVNGAESNGTLSQFDLTLINDYGTLKNPGLIKGLVVGDFSLAELIPVPGAIALITADEISDGVYQLKFVAETSGDVVQVTIVKTGFDFTRVNALQITLTP